MPGGRVRLISLIFRSAAAATVRLLPPISISAVPSTTSRPSTLALPVRSSLPILMSAMSLTGIGMHLELLHKTAYRVRAGDAGNGPHLRTDDPVLYGTEIDCALKIVGQPL